MLSSMQPLDRVAITVSIVLGILIGVLLWQGDQTAPQVKEFTWAGTQISAADTKFLLTFNRPMDQASVEANLRISPGLTGKFSWAGRRMAYTLMQPAPYGTQFTLTLEGAFDRFSQKTPSLPFSSGFSSRDRIFAYIGNQGNEKGRLVLHNLSQKIHQILTPPDRLVTDFRIYPDGKHILYTAAPGTNPANILEQELYRVTTGVDNKPGEVELILNAKDYQIFKFDLSPDGKSIVVQRLSRSVKVSYGLWLWREGVIKPLNHPPGGEFIIAPDNASLAITQGEGVAILPLEEKSEPLDFLPKFGNILCFNQDGSQAAMVQFNKNYTKSLFLVNNRGEEQKLLTIPGSILFAHFDFTNRFLYTVLTDVEQTATTYQESPFLAVIDIQNKKLKQLLKLKQQRNFQPNLAPDGSSLLFAIGQTPIPETLYSLSLPQSTTDQEPILENLNLSGIHPQWLP